MTAFALNGGTVRDGAGNNAVLTAAATNPAGVLKIDTTAPAVTAKLTSDTGVSATDKITSKDTLTGGGDPNATVQFTVDGTLIAATATAGATGVWTFTPTGLADGAHTIVASETDAAGNTGTAALAFTLDATAPKATAITASPASGDLDAGKTVSLTVTFSAPVYAGATSYLALNDGGHAVYAGGTGTGVLTFTYTVAAGQNTAALAVTGASAGFQDIAGNVPTFSGVVGALPGPLQIDTTAPTVTQVTASPASGEVKAGALVHVTLATSEAVTVTGTPQLLLNRRRRCGL